VITPKEIIERASKFSKEWEKAHRENSDKQTFWNEFFNVFGIERKKVAKFEETVKKYAGSSGFVDLFWKGELIVEHKSKGEDLDEAYVQAVEYADGLKRRDKPKFIIVSDFENIRVYDCNDDRSIYEEIKLHQLPKNVDLFGFISGYSRRKYKDEEPVNKKAAELIGDLHDVLLESGYNHEDLERLLVRILFCLFADDTTIFPKGIFREFIDEETYEDGTNVGSQLIHLFQILDTDDSERANTLSEKLALFPYVNGELFAERLETPSFNKKMREILLECCHFNWSDISPAIFGTMFQAIIHGVKRDELGAHYTSEYNIMKAVHGLFLDDLQEEFTKIKNNANRLKEFHNKIATLKFLDPACGCGNFLVITYREIRKIEIAILKQLKLLSGTNQLTFAVFQSQIPLDSFFGIEYDQSAVRISEVAMWLMEHKMNEELTGEFGKYIATIPLKKSPHIRCGNALRVDWNDLVPSKELSFILGNPPFISKNDRTPEQDEDMDIVFSAHIKNYKLLDYVCCWYAKAADYISGSNIKVGLVSTNSITQGEQVGTLWTYLFKRQIKIHFAHRTFKWSNEAKGKASVFVVIVGFANFDSNRKLIYDYVTPKSEPIEVRAANINPYLIDYEDIVITSRSKPLYPVPEMDFGNKPVDDGNFLFTSDEKNEFLKEEPAAKKFIKPFISAYEFLNGENRYCLWLQGVPPNEYTHLKQVMERINNVKAFRLASKKEATRDNAKTPSLFAEIRQPETEYVLIPRHSSETRKYVPFGFFQNDSIVADSCISLPNASLYIFGVLTSLMHMTWMRQVCGRIKSDYRYSNILVYNNFPFPTNVPQKNIEEVQAKATEIQKIRGLYQETTLSDLYNPNTMPKELLKAHEELDRAVDKCYGKQIFHTEMERLKFLFNLYKDFSEPLLSIKKKSKRAK
jgi:type II restriction/modification system DNA methylase subunit YeeA